MSEIQNELTHLKVTSSLSLSNLKIIQNSEENHLLNMYWIFELLKVTESGVNKKAISNPNTVRTSCSYTPAPWNLAKKDGCLTAHTKQGKLLTLISFLIFLYKRWLFQDLFLPGSSFNTSVFLQQFTEWFCTFKFNLKTKPH